MRYGMHARARVRTTRRATAPVRTDSLARDACRGSRIRGRMGMCLHAAGARPPHLVRPSPPPGVHCRMTFPRRILAAFLILAVLIPAARAQQAASAWPVPEHHLTLSFAASEISTYPADQTKPAWTQLPAGSEQVFTFDSATATL